MTSVVVLLGLLVFQISALTTTTLNLTLTPLSGTTATFFTLHTNLSGGFEFNGTINFIGNSSVLLKSVEAAAFNDVVIKIDVVGTVSIIAQYSGSEVFASSSSNQIILDVKKDNCGQSPPNLPSSSSLTCFPINPPTCNITCLGETQTLTCVNNSYWSNLTLDCSSPNNFCSGPPKTPDHGSLNCSNDHYNIGTTCTLTCDSGYQPTSSFTETRCTSSGEWSAFAACGTTIPADNCGPFTINPDLPATVECNAQSCHITCFIGGESQTVYCQTGGWSPFTLNCPIPQCDIPTAPLHGNMDCHDGYSAGAMCNLICDTGYTRKNGPSTTTCQNNGKWSAYGTCISDDGLDGCPPLPLPHFPTIVECPDGTSTCTISCINNATSVSVSCINGYWQDYNLNDCKFSQCPLPLPPSVVSACTNGSQVNSSCDFSCEKGFQVDGERISTCDENTGKWIGLGECKTTLANANTDNDTNSSTIRGVTAGVVTFVVLVLLGFAAFKIYRKYNPQVTQAQHVEQQQKIAEGIPLSDVEGGSTEIEHQTYATQ